MSSIGPPPESLSSTKVKADFCPPSIPNSSLKMLMRSSQMMQHRQSRPDPPRAQGIPSKPKDARTLDQKVHRTMPSTTSSNQTKKAIQPRNLQRIASKIPTKEPKTAPIHKKTGHSQADRPAKTKQHQHAPKASFWTRQHRQQQS